MTEATRTISMDLVHSLLREEKPRILDGVVGAKFFHPAFGILTVKSWSPKQDNNFMQLSVESHLGEKVICSEWMVENGIDMLHVSDEPLANALHSAVVAIVREEERRRKQLRQQEEMERRAEEERQRLLDQRWEKLVQGERRIREERLREQEEQDRIEQLEQQHRERYADSVRDIAETYRDQVTSRMPHVLPSTYEISDTSIAVLARTWFGASLFDRPASMRSQPELDPFLERTIEWWGSRDLWTQMRLIRHFTDHGFHKDALRLSLELESCATEIRLARAIRLSRFRTLSIAGFGTEAEVLGRALYEEQRRLDRYLSFALWGHYGRWPSLDPDERLRSWLKDYFREIGERPSSKDDHQIDELDYYSIEEMRDMLGSDSDGDDVPF